MGDTVSSAIQLSIVFLNFNRLRETRQTVEYLKELLAQRQDIEVIAVDNGSVDGTSEYLQTQQPWLHLVQMPNNIGIAGYNEGFKQARGKYLLVLDDDSHPKDAGTLDRLIEHLDTHPKVGIVACAVESPDGKTVTSWHLPAEGQTAGPSMAFVGCGFAIRRELFADIGWYPAHFFLYQNEMEVAIQTRQRGYQIHYDSQCRVIHREAIKGRTSWRRVYYPTRNTIWLIRRYFPFPSAAYLIISRLCFGLIRAIQARQLVWYYKAVKEAFNTPIHTERLPYQLRKELKTFWRQNSMFHHLFWALR